MSEKKTHFANLLKGAGFSILNLFIGIFVGLVLPPFLLRNLGMRYCGINEIMSTFVGCFALLNFGLDSAISRFFTLHYAKKEKQECLAIANTAFFLFLGLSSFAVLGFVLSALVVYNLYPEMDDRLLFLQVLLINGIAFSLNFPLKAFTGVVNGTMKQQLTGSRDVFFRLLGATLTFLVVYLGGKLLAISFVNLGIAVLNTQVMYRLARKAFPEFRVSWSLFDRSLVRKLFSFASSTFLVFVGDKIASRGGVFVIGAMITVDMVAPYSMVSAKIAGYFFSLMTVIGGGWLINWFTYLHANDEKKLIDQSLTFAYKVCAYAAIFIFFGIAVWSKDFILRWMKENGEMMLVAYPSLLLLSAKTLVTQSQSPNTKYLFAIAKHHLLAYWNLVGAVIQIVAMILLVKYGWGINGVALGSLLTSCCIRGFIIPISVCRIREENVFTYYMKLFSYWGRGAIACIIPAVISYYLLAPNYPRLVLVGALSALIYAPVIYLIGFNKEERNKLQELVLKKFRRKAAST